MATSASVCSTLLKRFGSKDDLRLVTAGETWVHYYEPENKDSSVGRAWVTEAKEVQDNHLHHVMATVFWDAKGSMLLNFLPKRSTVTGVYCAHLPDQLRTAICERVKLPKGVLLQEGIAIVHTCKVAMDAVERNKYELIPHPAYSPD